MLGLLKHLEHLDDLRGEACRIHRDTSSFISLFQCTRLWSSLWNQRTDPGTALLSFAGEGETQAHTWSGYRKASRPLNIGLVLRWLLLFPFL